MNPDATIPLNSRKGAVCNILAAIIVQFLTWQKSVQIHFKIFDLILDAPFVIFTSGLC